ncbi:succinylglutamate desuccinylase/aspartoacylase family protein [Natrinema salsiterrestre]|uniref:Succinylglutamate desuccinylase/aspartoacylase family protein n=1 Tax=Natrinema salsiterrestre TaxID=2950540 RepID=A0A9Q4L3F6_9EURY|nr:succinylglutamate desuccinylase/aspartoacylase family protein [Natrinema salsiterrestre]MDF9746872.1 succinylglutamate desuccinylase/aspartoacylase family protein [Natrinema salsiterrestre]
MADTSPEPFRYDAEVDPGETRHVRYEIGETYLGDPVEIPITVVNGEKAGATVFLTAALHGDELNGVKVLQEVADRYEPSDLHGTLVCLHVVNVPGYLAQQRDIPIYDQDLNRSFPGRERSNTAERMAYQIYERFISQCDLGLDFHTSTRNRTTMYHSRADMSNPAVERLAEAFGANVILAGAGEDTSLRSVATADGIPTITIEMGKAHRFQRPLIDKALEGVESVLAEYDVLPDESVTRPGWQKILGGDQEKRWLRADTGGLVDMQWGPTPLVHEGETICAISDHFSTEEHVVEAPFTGLLVGVLENPVALPGHPLCHLARIDSETHEEIEAEIDSGEFDGYRMLGVRWMGDGEEAE